MSQKTLRAIARPTSFHIHQTHLLTSRAFLHLNLTTMGKKKDKEKLSFQLKTPKGTKDWSGSDMIIRNWIFERINTVFARHGAVTLDTPVFELSEILIDNYGEDGGKLIYDLQDQGGEQCSLRYDLTVPFARWLAMNPNVQSIKRAHIGKVYRRDQPAMTKGRLREFYQCDFDIAGKYDAMLPDAEVLRIACEVFGSLGWAERTFIIKLNHRLVLDGVFEVCGVAKESFKTISSAVDKLDKLSWEEVKKEMLEKGLEEAVADRIWDFVQKRGGRDVLEELRNNQELKSNPNMVTGLEEVGLLFDYLEYLGIAGNVEFNLSLARGLDYYTGIIYEVVTEGSAPPTKTKQEPQRVAKKPVANDIDDDRSNDPSVGIGSIAGGGRYDNLVGKYSPGVQKPCVGISFGIERIFSIIKSKVGELIRGSQTDVFVMAIGGKELTGMVKERLQVCTMLWDADVKVRCLLILSFGFFN